MESLANWLAEHAGAVYTTIISFLGAYGVSLFVLVIGIIRTKLNAIKEQKESDARLQEVIEKFQAAINDMENKIIENSNVNTEKRLEAMKQIAAVAAAENSKLEDAEEITTEESALEGLN